MSYQVLARKYRPKNFQTLVGQDHVVRALTHALEQQRLHHAYLFTGTRGVGKTTLSRILAKSLNCETGITANPCGVCEACVAIDAGRFVDYIEMDAASNRGVDEMAQLLEQAVYAPGNARFKIYMIDEVHMLTNHAFNSMLKTLEEPPAHVKFILATTDPQKIPVTVLSRCLQFNLKQMPFPTIAAHLETILAQEKVTFDLPALRLLAQAAQGSMRDALSLTDQAIAYAAGAVNLDAVQGMLGALDQRYLIQILDALAEQNGVALLAVADQMAARSLSYKAALQDLATLLHQLSIAQFVESAISNDLPERAEILRLANLFDAEQVQLFYQIAVHGRSELHLAPDEYAGFSMTLLRMLAFRPLTDEPASLLAKTGSASGVKKISPAPMPAADKVSSQNQMQTQASANVTATVPGAVKKSPAMAALDALTERNERRSVVRNVESNVPPVAAKTMSNDSVETSHFAASIATSSEKKTELNVAQVALVTGEIWDGQWPDLATRLPLRGVAQQLALQSELFACEATSQLITLSLRIPVETLLASGSVEKLTGVLNEHFTVTVKVITEVGAVQHTAHAAALAERAMQQDAAESAIKNDVLVQSLIREFGAAIVPDSVKPIPII